jgi:hypothetical protein
MSHRLRDGGHEQLISNGGRFKPAFAQRDKRKPVLLGLSLARNLVKPLLSLYRTKWRERGYGLWTHGMHDCCHSCATVTVCSSTPPPPSMVQIETNRLNLDGTVPLSPLLSLLPRPPLARCIHLPPLCLPFSRARIFKLLRSPSIDSKEPIPPGCM